MEELAAEKENEEKTDKPKVPENPAQNAAAEDKHTEESSGENNSEIDKVIIDPEISSDNSSDISEDNSITEVTSDAESV